MKTTSPSPAKMTTTKAVDRNMHHRPQATKTTTLIASTTTAPRITTSTALKTTATNTTKHNVNHPSTTSKSTTVMAQKTTTSKITATKNNDIDQHYENNHNVATAATSCLAKTPLMTNENGTYFHHESNERLYNLLKFLFCLFYCKCRYWYASRSGKTLADIYDFSKVYSYNANAVYNFLIVFLILILRFIIHFYFRQ